MKWIIYLFLALLGFAGLLLVYLQLPGFIEVRWLGYEARLSIIVAFLLALFGILTFFVLGAMLLWIVRLPFRLLSFLKRRRQKKTQNEMVELLSSIEAEILSDALFHQKKIGQRLKEDPFFLWFSGNTFAKANKLLEAEKCFIGLTKCPLSMFLGLKGQIRAALHRRDSKLAYILLEQAEKLVPTSPWVLKHFAALAYEQRNFKKAETLIHQLEDLGYCSAEQSNKQIAYLYYLDACEGKISTSQKEELLRQAHNLDPNFVEITEALANLLYTQGKKEEALYVIKTTWGLTPTQALGNLYVTLSDAQNEVEAYQIACQLVVKNKKSPESLLLLAHYALKAKLWGETRAHLKDLLKQHPTAEAYHLFATLELEENQDFKAAIDWLAEGLQAPRENRENLLRNNIWD